MFRHQPPPCPYPYPSMSPQPQQQQQQHKVITAFELEQTNMALSEIQRDLRSLLRIHS
ncbi:hypothetical protein BDF20DRAFT_874671 [Mycotypha africana]|uniref:uncharacterized protein n=1 Tax=Mycotypha africana TaxID=64632 RepID=UPI0023011449|nr:uncharacterized protein BDF20DRAFT_874671 [Mycotypha africana]KAI8977419.1 hypothetical protein BDF20DRAFT_874671 [Mycotypha africana]